MATVVSVMDRDGWNERTDNIVVVDADARRLLWVPRDLWCEGLGDRVNTAFAAGGHDALRAALEEHGIAIEHGICLRRAAAEAALERVVVEVPVPESLLFEYPDHDAETVEEGSRAVSFEPPSEVLRGERIHEWLGARFRVGGGSSDLERIERQQVFVEALLGQGADLSAAIADLELADLSGPGAVEEVRRAEASWSFEVLDDVAPDLIDGKEVLVREAPVGTAGERVSRLGSDVERRPTPNLVPGRAGAEPRGVVVHTTDGTCEATIAWFASPESKVSSHYLVSLGGRVFQFVDEADTARHAGRGKDPTADLIAGEKDPNLITIGIEFEDGGDPQGVARPDGQYRAGARLITEICSRWGIPLDREHVIGHREIFAAKSCPGNLDIDRLLREASGPTLTCLVPVRNGAQDLPGFLDSVAELADSVVALDDGSSDETLEMLEGDPRVNIVLTNPRRDGHAGWDDADNRRRLLEAAAELSPDWAIFVDADERIDPEDAAALRRFLATDAIPGCAYGLELHRDWNGRAAAGFTWVYRLFAFAENHSLPERRLHFNPVPTQIPRRAWIRTTIRLRHLDGPERLAERHAKYEQADPERSLERRPARLLAEPGDLVPWSRREPGRPVLDPAAADRPSATPELPSVARVDRPRLVCLVPVKEGAQDIPGYLESVGRFADAVIALDDGSTDGTAEILEESEIVARVIRHPVRPDYGGWDEGETRRRLLEAAAELRPVWIMWLDADELIDPDDALALRTFVERAADPSRAYGFRVFRMINDLDHYDRAGLWVYRLFAWEPGQRLEWRLLHMVPIPSSIPRERWVRTTIRIKHLSSLTKERRQIRYRKYEQADPDRKWQSDYSHLLEVGAPKSWRPRPRGLPVLADPNRRSAAILDLESIDLDAPVLSAIVISRNDEDRIEQVVRSVVEQECPQPFEVIVVVSGTDRTAEIVSESFPGVRLVELEGKALPGRARNAGVAMARGDYLSFPGSHIELPPGSLAARMEAHERGHAMVTGTILNGTPTRSGWASYFLDHSASLPGRPSGELSGPPDHCSYVRDFLLEVGGFPEHLRAGEDTVVNQRLAARGYRGYREQGIRLTHRSRCSSPPRLFRHHFQRGRGLGRIVLADRVGGDRVLSLRFLRNFLLGYVSRRLSRTRRNVSRWADQELASEYRRSSPLIAAGAVAAWSGLWFELLRPGRGKLGTLLVDQRDPDVELAT